MNIMNFPMSVHHHFQYIKSSDDGFLKFHNNIENPMHNATSMLQWIKKKIMNILFILNIPRIYCY